MSVEILSVSLDDETIEKLANAVVRVMSNRPVSANPQAAAPEPQDSAPPPQDDPWAGSNAQPASQSAPQAQTQQQPAQGQGGPNPPQCFHGNMRFVPGGFSRSTNKPYPAFWACPTERGAPDKCKSKPA